ncbi:MAG: inositol monophosphatase [Caldisphaeraceae archaeon]|nr:inositol monophosphatase [Caldisphaeraceae archaeon]
MKGLDPELLRKSLVEISLKAVGYLRKNFCTDEALEIVRGETIRADLASEKIIIDSLKELGIDFQAVTEESGLVGNGKYKFIIDPLDGSVNYKSCIPWCSVSIAVLSEEKDVIAGVVAPVYGDGYPFSFSRGNGCYEGDRRIKPDKGSPNILFSYIEKLEQASDVAKIASREGLKVRSLGSSALEIIYAALNRSFAFLDLRGKLRNVDVSASLGFLKECGGVAKNEKGDYLRIDDRMVSSVGNVIASREEKRIEKIIKILNGEA